MNITTLYDKNEVININTYLEKNGISNPLEYLNPSGIALENPYIYKNMREAVDLFKYHYLQNDICYILYDADFDGYSSGTMLYKYMMLLNPNWNVKILFHNGKDRGLEDDELFNKIIEEKPSFLIIPDAGSNSVDKTRAVFDNGTDVLVIDHHSIKTPIECGVLISNQFDDGVDSNGSGCLVTHIFLKALDLEFNVKYSNKFIDLVSMSIISDSMDVSSIQNRTYLEYGILHRENITNKFILKLCDKFIGKDYDTYTHRQLSFNIVPKFNACIRMQDVELKQKLCLALLEYGDLDEVAKLCEEVHKQQTEKVAEIIDNNMSELDKLSNNNIMIFASDMIPRSYSGLVSGKIMGIYNKPTIVGSIKDGELIGSLRTPISLQKELDDNELVEWCSGHDYASGICIKESNIDRLVDYYNSLETLYTPHIEVLSSYSIKSIPSNLFGKFDGYDELWSNKGLPKPLFHIKDIIFEPKDWNIIGKDKRTLKMSINGCDVLIFKALREQKELLGLGYYENDTFVNEPKYGKLKLECTAFLSVNEYRGRKTNQIIIDSFEVSEYSKKNKEDLF